MENYMKIALLLGILLTFSQYCTAQSQQVQNRELPNKEMIKQNRKIVQLSSKEISKTLPQSIDKYTTLTTVDGVDNTLVYKFEINTGAKSDEAVKNEDKTRMREAVTLGVCQSSKRFLDAQINISYIYLSATSKEELFRFDITQAKCTALNSKLK